MSTALPIHGALIERCKKGEKEAFEQLYRLYARSMFNVGYRIVNDEEEAEDVLQEAFISAFRNIEHYRGESTFGAWLKRIVINKAINVLKSRRFERMPEEDTFDVADTDNVELELPFSVTQVRTAMEQLPDGYRSVLSLYLLEGYDHEEIAEIMNITISTSKSQLNRSKKKLKEILEGGTYE